MNPLGVKVKKLRVLRSFSQQYLADKLRITQSTYCRYESGGHQIPEALQREIAFLLGISFEAFRNFNEEKLFFYIEKMYCEPI